ncbi:hypothetical protein AKJ09_05523 [Labilithrix luteola]|uniref:Tetratricopeptide repeat protein n=1 Tax=Labilithrix luteola TaxID=1391654 RepID=A0A0K1Q0C7_9BACT|nr:hypothetical protein AKJ09_05523 [Labilithrix luteola]
MRNDETWVELGVRIEVPCDPEAALVTNFLYGDSTASPLTSNFLEFLRDAVDFTVFVLQADERIKQCHERVKARKAEANQELARLERFVGTVAKAIETAEKGAATSPASRCAGRLNELVVSTHKASIEAAKVDLAADLERIDADEAATRQESFDALASMITRHDLHGASAVTRLVLDGGRYVASLSCQASFGLEWVCELGADDANVFASALRIDRIAPQLEIRAPQVSGWITKEVKVRPQKLERFLVRKLSNDGTTLSFELRAESGGENGFDFEIELSTMRLTAVRVGPQGDAANGPFEIHGDDLAALLDLSDKLARAAAAFEKRRLLNATFAGTDFQALPTFIPFVERLVGMMAPVLHVISERSLTQNELVLRRALGNDRREEIFVAKGTLREKYDVLAPALRTIFKPLRLEPETRAKTPPPPAPTNEATPMRAELPASKPPPPPGTQPRPVPIPPLRAPRASAPSFSSIEVKDGQPLAESKPNANGTPPATNAKARESVTSEAKIAASPAPPPAVPAPKPAPANGASGGLSLSSLAAVKNEALAAALKKITMLYKNGRLDDAYPEFSRLFTGPKFATFAVDERRHALELMLVRMKPARSTPEVLEAYRAAVTHLKGLSSGRPEARDHEMLGLAFSVLEDPKSARSAFEKALELERARDAKSERCEVLAKRIEEIAEAR